MKKLLVFGIVGMFLFSVAVGAMEHGKSMQSRSYEEKRPIVPVYSKNGIVWSVNSDDAFMPLARKPGNGHGNGHGPPNSGGGGGGSNGSTGDGVVNKWALCIGIADYEGTENDLTYPDDDAQDWKNFLQSKGYHVTILTNSQATASNIESAIDELLANEDGDDYVVFTYSGHGTTYKKYGSCMISYDMVLLSNGWLKAKFDAADSQHIFFAFDACKIGDFEKVVTNNRVGAFASDKDYSYDGTSGMNNGVFTYYEMDGWEHYNTFEQDSAYAVQKMEEWAAGYAGVNVDPFYVDNYAGDMTP
ncbi:MAG: caspase family protein [Thermoplasmata archaeon]|nr:caspase family protein [Thermoplasmata archaeon]